MNPNNISDITDNSVTNEEENKKIDNRVLTPKERINNIDDRLDNARKKIQNLNDMQENVETIAKSMNKCIDLLTKSIRGPRINTKLSDMRNSNKMFLIRTSASIEEETMETRKTINELYKEKDEILKETRNNYNEKQSQMEKEKAETDAAREKIFSDEDNIFENGEETNEEKE